MGWGRLAGTNNLFHSYRQVLVLHFILSETRPTDVLPICLNVIHFFFNVFSMACKFIAFCPINDINRGGSGSGLEQSGDAQEAVVFSVAEFSSFYGKKDVVRRVGTIKCMQSRR